MKTDLIRDALERQAEHTPDPQGVLGALPLLSAQRVRRQRRLQVATAAAVAVAVVAVTPTLLAVQPSPSGPGATIGMQPGAGAVQSIPLRYRPAWLPPDLREATSGVALIDGVTANQSGRSYTRGEGNTLSAAVPSLGISVTVTPGPHEGGTQRSYTNSGGKLTQIVPEPVDINGVRGTYEAYPSMEVLTWKPASNTTIRFTHRDLGLDKATLVRIARSMVPDTGSRSVPLTVGWWPRDLTAHGADVSAPGRPGMASVYAGAMQVTVAREVGDHVPAGGQSLTVDGHRGRWVTVPQGDRPLTYLVVQLAPERVLTVEVNNGFVDGAVIGRDDSIRVAESVIVDEGWPGWDTGS